MESRGPWASLALLFGVGLVLHGLLAWVMPAPPQWDSAYAWEVGRNLARGEGSVTRAVWALAWLPPEVEHPADLHWMPLPSRVLVPALWVDSSWRAAQVVPVLLAALWGPLGWLWARRIGLDGWSRLGAGGLALTGLGAMSLLSVPDSVALFGVVGGGALLAAAERRLALCVVLAALAALTRGDGFWIGVACSVAFVGWRMALPALAGIGATAGWTLRNYAIAGEGFLALRSRVSSAGATGDLLLLAGPESSLLDRLGGAALAIPRGALFFVLEGGLLPVVFAGVALWVLRKERRLWPLGLLAVLVLVGDPLLAPGVAGQGTLWRTLAVLVPPMAALALLGSQRVLTGLPRPLLPSVVALSGVALAAPLGFRLQAPHPIPDDCAALRVAQVPREAPVLVTEAIQVAARCDRPAVQIPPSSVHAGVQRLSGQYEIEWMVLAPDDHRVPAWRSADFQLDGWVQAEGRVWRRQRR